VQNVKGGLADVSQLFRWLWLLFVSVKLKPRVNWNTDLCLSALEYLQSIVLREYDRVLEYSLFDIGQVNVMCASKLQKKKYTSFYGQSRSSQAKNWSWSF